MYCKKCDSILEEKAEVCPKCGKKVKMDQKTKVIIISIIIVLVASLAGFLIADKILTDKRKEELATKKVEIKKIDSKNYVTFANYTFALPNTLQFSNEKNYVYGATSDMTISFKMNVVNVNYAQILANYESFIKTIVETGTVVNSYSVFTTNEKEYFLIAIKQNNVDYLYALTELDSNYTVQAKIQSSTIEGYEKGVDYINQIIDEYEIINASLNIENTGSLDDFLVNNISGDITIGDLFN